MRDNSSVITKCLAVVHHLRIETFRNLLLLFLVFLLIDPGVLAQKRSAYVLPPMPEKETKQLGFIADPAGFPEVKIYLTNGYTI